MMTNITTSFEHCIFGSALPVSYQPTPHTVVIGRGNEPKQNVGNKRLRVLAQSFLQKYQNGDRKCKTNIVNDIVGMIQEACKGGKGAFVKHNKKAGKWYTVDNVVAREKVGYVFRDLLADEYKSSAKSKAARRQPHHPTLFLQQQDLSSSLSTQSHSTTTLCSPSSSTIIMKKNERDTVTVGTSPPSCFFDQLTKTTIPFLPPPFTFSFHDVEEDVKFDFESLLRQPLLCE